MNTIPTAEEFLLNKLDETQPDSNRPPTPKEVEVWLIEFARLHVNEALSEANKEVLNVLNTNCYR